MKNEESPNHLNHAQLLFPVLAHGLYVCMQYIRFVLCSHSCFLSEWFLYMQVISLLTTITCMLFGTAGTVSTLRFVCSTTMSNQEEVSVATMSHVVHALLFVVNAVVFVSMSMSASGHIHLLHLPTLIEWDVNFMPMII